MTPNPLKITVDRFTMEGFQHMIAQELESLSERKGLRGSDFLNLKVIADVHKRHQNKVNNWDKKGKKYTISLDKGEAWALLFCLGNKIHHAHPARQVLGEFHRVTL